jgi:hypothetical protein
MATRLLLVSCVIAIAASAAFSQSGGIGPGKTPHPVIKNKPEPDWPRSIEKKSELIIVLRAIFSSEAKVTNIRFIETKPMNPAEYSEGEIKDLIERAKDAARQIKFVPATKDGRNVSMWMELEYEFNLDEKPAASPSEPKKPSNNR